MATENQREVLTNRSDVLANFKRYYGREPSTVKNAQGFSDMDTIDWLTQFPPQEVEQTLAKSSPITRGKLWRDFQAQAQQDQINPPTSDGNLSEAELKGLANKYGLNEAQTEILKVLEQEDYANFNANASDKDIADMVSGAMSQTEQALLNEAKGNVMDTYNKYLYDDLQKMKTQMADLRNSASRFTQQEALSYKQKLRNTKESLAARGMSYSGEARRTLGKEGSLNSAGVEGEVPQQRRYNWEDNSAKIQQAARDAGQAFETKYGSRITGANQADWGQFNNPYGNGTDYQAGNKKDIYNSRRIVNGKPQEGYVLGRGQSGLYNPTADKNARYYSTYENNRNAAIDRELRRSQANKANYN